VEVLNVDRVFSASQGTSGSGNGIVNKLDEGGDVWDDAPFDRDGEGIELSVIFNKPIWNLGTHCSLFSDPTHVILIDGKVGKSKLLDDIVASRLEGVSVELDGLDLLIVMLELVGLNLIIVLESVSAGLSTLSCENEPFDHAEEGVGRNGMALPLEDCIDSPWR
jgi:hypothetical protein